MGLVQIAPVISAGIALVIAIIALVNARIARRQAATAREALDLQLAERDRRDAPEFELRIEPCKGEYTAHVDLRMISGPHGVTVSITYINGWARRIGPDEIEWHETQGGTVRTRQMVKGATSQYAHMAPENAQRIRTTAIVNSKDMDSDRTWEWVQRLEWEDAENLLFP